MKRIKFLAIITGATLALILLTACKGTKEIEGVWHAQESSGKNLIIEFLEEEVVVEGKKSAYSQEGFGNRNGVSYVYFKQNGEYYSIIFPDKDHDLAVLIEPKSTDNYLEGKMLYALNRNEEPNYQEYVKKYFR